MAVMLAATAGVASAATSSEIEGLPLLDPLAGEESPLSDEGQWGALAWANDSPAAGVISPGKAIIVGNETPGGWHPAGEYPAVAGAFWKTFFTQQSAAVVTVAVLPGEVGRYQALWLDMPEPGSAHSGYELRWTYKAPGAFTLTLSKWSAGVRTELASSTVTILKSTRLAIADEGSVVRAWQENGEVLTPVLSAKDSSYSSGYTGMESDAGPGSRMQGFFAGSLVAEAPRADQIAGLTLRDSLKRGENPLSDGGKWSALHWSTDSPATGIDTTTGWRPFQVYPTISGSYWSSSFEGPSAASVTMAAGTGIAERHQALWLDMPNPGTERSGYELSWTFIEGNSYAVELSKWSAGAQTELGYVRMSIGNGDILAISDEGSTVRAWLGTEGSFSSVLSAADSSYSGGHAGIEASGTNGLLTEFKAASLVPESNADAVAALTSRDQLNRSEIPLSNGSQWAALNWSADSPTTGIDTTAGWRPNQSYPAVSGAYWKTSFEQMWGASVTLAATTGAEEREQALWIDMSSPGTVKSGYELSWTYKTSSSYKVELSKWTSGTQAELASITMPIGVGSTLALVDEGSNVRAWVGAGGSFGSILSAADSSYSSGYAGIQGTGNNGRLSEFKVGPLVEPPAAAAVAEVPLQDTLNRNENPLSNHNEWKALEWSTDSPATGVDATGGWHPAGASAVSATYWGVSVSEPGAASVTIPTAPDPGKYQAIWIDLLQFEDGQSGYELRWTAITAPQYTVELSRWTEGTRTVLASSTVSIATGSSMAISDEGSRLRAWIGSGGSFLPILQAEDVAYSLGFAGIQADGTTGRLTEFKAGS
ncbi:MAG TPA: hypothetical protein VN671_06460 [Solirubrobacterales bacterium]|nr:hypothetical protein [Solirubrobacterales bacterium]